VLSIGVTGHRREALPADSCDDLKERIRGALTLLVESALAVREQEADFIPASRRGCCSSRRSPTVPTRSPPGSRSIWDSSCMLSCRSLRRHSSASLPDDQSRKAFDELLEKASCVLELPGEHEHPERRLCDDRPGDDRPLRPAAAVWDGLPPRGRGGTGEVVELAVVNGTPVVHVPIDPNEPSRLLWSAFDPTVVTHRVERTTERPLDDLHLAMLLTALFAPPADPQERHFLSIFGHERIKRSA
jgi:hypothetical protein